MPGTYCGGSKVGHRGISPLAMILFQHHQALVCNQPPSQLGFDGAQQEHSTATLEVCADPELAVGGLSKIICYKCGEKGHGVKECLNKVLCNVCGKDSHLSAKCAWLR